MVYLQSVSEVQRSIYQTTVATAMDEVSHNRVINQHPPPISDNERQLPSVNWTTLAQLRSGWSKYSASIIPRKLDRCPSRNQTPHDSVHLLCCLRKFNNHSAYRFVAEPDTRSGLIRATDHVTTSTNILNSQLIIPSLIHNISTRIT